MILDEITVFCSVVVLEVYLGHCQTFIVVGKPEDCTTRPHVSRQMQVGPADLARALLHDDSRE